MYMLLKLRHGFKDGGCIWVKVMASIEFQFLVGMARVRVRVNGLYIMSAIICVWGCGGSFRTSLFLHFADIELHWTVLRLQD